ncbi:MAG: SAM-dependent methyltransferase [Acidimicrobiia bacterium]
MTTTPKSFHLTPEVHAYILDHSSALDPIATELVGRTAELGGVSIMQIAPEQAVFMTLITQAVGARVAVEVEHVHGNVGARDRPRAPSDGRLTCCDVSEDWTSIAREFWQRAGVADRIDLRMSPAAETRDVARGCRRPRVRGRRQGRLHPLLGRVGPRMRGGSVLVDNTLRGGTVADSSNTDDTTEQAAFSDHAVADGRMDVVVLAVGDGLTFARRRTERRQAPSGAVTWTMPNEERAATAVGGDPETVRAPDPTSGTDP